MAMSRFFSSVEIFLASGMLKPHKESFSGPIIFISIISLALGLSVMILSLLVLTGFKKEISEKLSGFTGHIHIVKYNSSNSLEMPPVYLDSIDLQSVVINPQVAHVQSFVSKAAIIRTNEEIHGVMAKGVGRDFDSVFFSNNLIQGKIPDFYGIEKSDDILISQKIAQSLKVNLGDFLRVYFVSNENSQLRGRRLQVAGIYKTSVEEFDERFILADIRHLQKLNNWSEQMVSGVEVYLNDFDQMEQAEESIYRNLPYDLTTESIKDRYPQIFDWLQLQDMNVVVILVLIILVSTVSMISTLLVLILERTQTIGILKSLGARNSLIWKLFIFQSAYIIIIGMFIGNLFGLGLAWLQKTYGWVRLDAETYYMSVVPIHMDVWSVIWLNLGTLLLVLLFMVIPALVSARIQPAESIRWE